MKQVINSRKDKIIAISRSVYFNATLALGIIMFASMSVMVIKFTIKTNLNTDIASLIGGGTIGVAIILFLMYIRNFASYFSKPFKLRQNPIEDSLEYILYLRSFRSDQDINSLRGDNFMNYMSLIYPIYAISNNYKIHNFMPRIKLINKTNENWKDGILEYKNQAKFIILSLDYTSGLLWEIDSLKDKMNKVLIVINNEKDYVGYIENCNNNSRLYVKQFNEPIKYPVLFWQDIDGKCHSEYYSRENLYKLNFIRSHPWQSESVDWLLNYVGERQVSSRFIEFDKNYMKLFIDGDNTIYEKFSILTHIIMLIFPFLFNIRDHCKAKPKKNPR